MFFKFKKRLLRKKIYVQQVDGCYDLLSYFIDKYGVYNFIRQLDEKTYIGIWSTLLELKDKYPHWFEDYKEVDE